MMSSFKYWCEVTIQMVLYNVGAFWVRHGRKVGMLALVLGFAFDIYLTDRPDNLLNTLLLLGYLVLAAGCIVFTYLRSNRNTVEFTHGLAASTFIMQFSFGALASNLLVLYGRSGTLGGSGLFVAILAMMLFGNEFLHTRYSQLRFNIAVYYLLLFTFSIIAVPIYIFHRIGTEVFIWSGVLSLSAMSLFLFIVYFEVLRGRGKLSQFVEIGAPVLTIFLAINALYFLHVIPPVPLSLKTVGVYHSVMRNDTGNYDVTYEPTGWYVFWRNTSKNFASVSGGHAYCFSSVYAPGGLRTPINHVWQWFDDTSKSWQTKETISFNISGGRADGYRGYTISPELEAGAWRCQVETQEGLLVGRIPFTVSLSSSSVLVIKEEV